MKGLLYKTSKFIYEKRKQILFALFALICSILDKECSTDILKCAAPAVVAAGAAASGATAAAGGTAAGAAASTAAGTGAGASAGAASSSAASTAAGTTAGGTSTTAGVNTGKNLAAVKSNVANNVNTSQPINSNVTPKNTNPKGTHSNSLSNNTGSDNLTKKSEGMNEGTNKAEKKDASTSDVEKEKKQSKKQSMSSERNQEENEEDNVGLDNAADEITKGSGGAFIGCGVVSVFLLIFSVPLIILLFISPTSSTMSQVDCSVQGGVNCVEDEETGGFFNKLKNLFSHGVYATNYGVVTEKIVEVYEKLKNDENFIINVPLLTSSLFADSEFSKTEFNENNELVITEKMLERLEYLEDLARLQMVDSYFIYTCNEKNVNGKLVYYKQTNYDDINPDTISFGDCNSSTVGMIFKEKITTYNEEEYFEVLEKSDILDLIYSDYIESDLLLITKIKNQYRLYNSLNLIYAEDEEYNTIPQSLFNDSNINLQAPLKGWYNITSPFGMRYGEYAGMHKGIDLVSSDKNIYAAGWGVVTRSNVETEGGNVIEITHTSTNGVEYVTQYAHLSQRLVNVGDVVNSGDIIGIMGDTGTLASGVHLHFSIWRKSPYELLNPKNLF